MGVSMMVLVQMKLMLSDPPTIVQLMVDVVPGFFRIAAELSGSFPAVC